jgi:hypothetical protein
MLPINFKYINIEMTKLFACILFIFVLPAMAIGQVEIPAPSPKASVMQTVGLTKITISYSSPGVKGRKIWGEIIPYGKVWRTGANEATTIEFSDTVSIVGNKVPGGKYAIFSIPGENEWTFILSKKGDQFGAYSYSEKDDFLRIKVRPSKSGEFNERLYFTVAAEKENTGLIKLYWENIKIEVPVETEVKKKVERNIKSALGEGDNRWAILTESADYYLKANYDLLQALKWINESISLRNYYWNNWVKSRILAAQNNYKEAIKQAGVALQVGDANDAFFKEDKEMILHDIELWKKK